MSDLKRWAELSMSLPEKAFNSVVDALKLVVRIEPVLETALKDEKIRRQQLDETLSYPASKVVTRSDGKERVRIVQRGQNFGAVVDFDDPKCGWSPEHILAGGFVYESPTVAETEARAVLGWLNALNQENSFRSEVRQLTDEPEDK